VGPKPATSIATFDRILAHAREQPTVYLPTHDPDSATRLAERSTL
jgi:N-acyl homoserine lactone hydrolase